MCGFNSLSWITCGTTRLTFFICICSWMKGIMPTVLQTAGGWLVCVEKQSIIRKTSCSCHQCSYKNMVETIFTHYCTKESVLGHISLLEPRRTSLLQRGKFFIVNHCKIFGILFAKMFFLFQSVPAFRPVLFSPTLTVRRVSESHFLGQKSSIPYY